MQPLENSDGLSLNQLFPHPLLPPLNGERNWYTFSTSFTSALSRYHPFARLLR